MRFSGFNNNWEKTIIKNVFNFRNGKAHEQNVDYQGNYIIINSKFISTDGTIIKRTNDLLCPLYKNDIVMVMSDVPKGKAIAKCYLINENDKYSLNQRICALGGSLYPKFYLEQINRNRYFLKFDDGVSQTNLKKEDILNCPIYITTKKEEEKIQKFLLLIDKKIDKQQELVDNLKKYKRGLLTQIINRKLIIDKKEIWNNITLQNCCICLDNKRVPITASDRKKGNYPYYGANGIQDYIDDYIFDGEYILIAEDGGYFDNYREKEIAQYVNGKFWVNNHAHILKCKKEYNCNFIYYELVHKDIRKYINGSSRAKLNKEDMWKIELSVPYIETQIKISKIFSNLDKKIEIEEYLLQKIHFIKQGLLQQLFI